MAVVVLYRLAKEKDEAKLNSNSARYNDIFNRIQMSSTL